MRATIWLLTGFLQPFSVLLLFQQNEYKIFLEHLEAPNFNKLYLTHCETQNFKYNRTQAAVNITLGFKQDLGNELRVEIQSYRLASNEYRHFPIQFGFNFCKYASTNELGLGELFACGNFTCPTKKGLYFSCNWKPNSQKYPPNVPAGSYKHDLKFYYHSVEVFVLQVYGTVKYPEIKGWTFF